MKISSEPVGAKPQSQPTPEVASTGPQMQRAKDVPQSVLAPVVTRRQLRRREVTGHQLPSGRLSRRRLREPLAHKLRHALISTGLVGKPRWYADYLAARTAFLAGCTETELGHQLIAAAGHCTSAGDVADLMRASLSFEFRRPGQWFGDFLGWIPLSTKARYKEMDYWVWPYMARAAYPLIRTVDDAIALVKANVRYNPDDVMNPPVAEPFDKARVWQLGSAVAATAADALKLTRVAAKVNGTSWRRQYTLVAAKRAAELAVSEGNRVAAKEIAKIAALLAPKLQEDYGSSKYVSSSAVEAEAICRQLDGII